MDFASIWLFLKGIFIEVAATTYIIIPPLWEFYIFEYIRYSNMELNEYDIQIFRKWPFIGNSN